MGLEGMRMDKMAADELTSCSSGVKQPLPGQSSSAVSATVAAAAAAGSSKLALDAADASWLLDEASGNGMSLLQQAQALIRKSLTYQQIDQALHRLPVFQPSVYHNVPRSTASALPTSNHHSNSYHYRYHDNDDDDDNKVVTSLHRDAAVNNMRLLCVFYGYAPATFALAVNLLDRLLGKVKAHPKYLSCIAACCFLISAKSFEANAFIPSATELVKLSQCGGTAADLLRMERLILDKLQWQVHPAATPLLFLQLFHTLLADTDPRIASVGHLPQTLTSHLEVLLCQFDFTRYRADLLALALLSYKLQELNLFNSAEHFTPIVELQYYCQMNEAEFLECRGQLIEYLQKYASQPSKLPRLHLQWSISRRTLSKAKPSTRVLLDLETIMEDEDLDGIPSDDAGVFDSENDDFVADSNNNNNSNASGKPLCNVLQCSAAAASIVLHSK